jgi:hypothetical protein
MIGGGYIAAEFSHIAARAGASVTVLQRGARMASTATVSGSLKRAVPWKVSIPCSAKLDSSRFGTGSVKVRLKAINCRQSMRSSPATPCSRMAEAHGRAAEFFHGVKVSSTFRRWHSASGKAFPTRCSRPSRRCGRASPIRTTSPIRVAKPGRIDGRREPASERLRAGGAGRPVTCQPSHKVVSVSCTAPASLVIGGRSRLRPKTWPDK